ncbi:PF08818 domain protein [Leptospira interrogans serovar Pyrogenes str. L0374]|uniref:PF08818 domain protein n=1 Tax=Leptospira interrogans serovar Pyrogenes str. L0374 TaxID=1049928 RepID=M6KBF9_LEPIR|nr:PF08818 domain protein [Leptospira interrogans serovar Pyrogenes str. L0374]
MSKIKFTDPNVAEVFKNYPNEAREKLLELRKLIFNTANSIEGVGTLEETLKWGQPSYLTSETKSGSTIRIDKVPSKEDKYALYFHCQTNLISTFKELFPKKFEFEGNRSIHLNVKDPIPNKELKVCISLALTYHLNKNEKDKTFWKVTDKYA